jgi:hypothetical protein
MIWVDRLALAWGGLLIIIGAMAWKGPGYLLDDPGVWYILELLVGLPWLILRALDFIVTGRVRLGLLGAALGRNLRRQPDITVMPPHPAPRSARQDIWLAPRER